MSELYKLVVDQMLPAEVYLTMLDRHEQRGALTAKSNTMRCPTHSDIPLRTYRERSPLITVCNRDTYAAAREGVNMYKLMLNDEENMTIALGFQSKNAI